VLLFLVLFLIVAPIIEIAVFIQVGDWVGFGPAILLLILVSIVGVWVVKHQGTGVLRRMRTEIQAGRVPTAELIDGVLILAAGLLLLLPGFVSDILALLLLVPIVRHVPNTWVRKRAAVRVASRVGTAGATVVVRSRERRTPPEPPRPPDALGP
jgi:UPF0716 protein FxsA